MTDPENETAPMRIVNAEATTAPSDSRSACRSSRIATSAAAPPPTPLNSATSCGIAVIATRRAPSAPGTAPTATASRIQPRLSMS
jgi:hypothetical protein